MDVDSLLTELWSSPTYHGQIVHIHEIPARPAEYATDAGGLSDSTLQALGNLGLQRLYNHQAEAIHSLLTGEDVLIVTGAASGKSLCYIAPILEMLQAEPQGRALLLFPTKALCQDQFRTFRTALEASGLQKAATGVFDGDTSPATRRSLRDRASVLFSNPDMLHASLMPQHIGWASFLSNLRYVVLDELHVYNGIFGANMANLLRRFGRLCQHYGSRPQIVACSATIGNPKELAERLTGREMTVIDRDGSPRGRRVYVLWNPPVVRHATWRSRRSANVEAHELMAQLVRRGAATITFSKAKMTAEMIHRYVCEALERTAPDLKDRVTSYRGGYLPEERREIERRLFAGELLGVSSTSALELGIDVGALDACVIVGYPGKLASFFQQSGRAGRREREALVLLIGLDTTVNQYVMSHPEYVFTRPIEQAVVDANNPFVVTGHLRCAAHEMPLQPTETAHFGPHADLVLKILQENHKVRYVNGQWYHAASETPQHEVSLRSYVEKNVTIHDADTGEVLGEVSKLDAPPILHPEAVYMHRGDTYRVLSLDLERGLAIVKREDVDYYTQPLGGTDVHHIDACLREKPFGTGHAFWGEVTAYFRTMAYEKIRFYELDAISRHNVALPDSQLETMAVWMVPPEGLMHQVRQAGLDVHSGLRGVGYATRMLLPLFITCETLDFSHSIGSVNSPWNAIFIYERYPLGLGYTQRAYELLHQIMPAVRDQVRKCPCENGCPCCVGKPLRQYTTWNVERGEASIPSKAATLAILDGLLSDGTNLACADTHALSDSAQAQALHLEQALRRRLERMREARVFHPIQPQVPTSYPKPEGPQTLDAPDVARRVEQRKEPDEEVRKRLAKRLGRGDVSPPQNASVAPKGMRGKGSLTPRPFSSPPALQPEKTEGQAGQETPGAKRPADSVAARARKLKRERGKGGPG